MADQLNQLPVLQRFHHWLRDSTVTCKITSEDHISGSHQFVPYSAVEAKFKGDEDYSFAWDLRNAVLQSDRNIVAAQDIAETCPKVFCILLDLKQGACIAEFVHNDSLHDSRLPLDTCPKEFPRVYPELFEDFRERQWKFCAPEMRNANDLKFKDERILPFVERQRIAEGGSATNDKVIIHSDYDRLFSADGGGLCSCRAIYLGRKLTLPRGRRHLRTIASP